MGFSPIRPNPEPAPPQPVIAGVTRRIRSSSRVTGRLANGTPRLTSSPPFELSFERRAHHRTAVCPTPGDLTPSIRWRSASHGHNSARAGREKNMVGHNDAKTTRRSMFEALKGFALDYLVADTPPLTPGARWHSFMGALLGLLLTGIMVHLAVPATHGRLDHHPVRPAAQPAGAALVGARRVSGGRGLGLARRRFACASGGCGGFGRGGDALADDPLQVPASAGRRACHADRPRGGTAAVGGPATDRGGGCECRRHVAGGLGGEQPRASLALPTVPQRAGRRSSRHGGSGAHGAHRPLA